jgi:hypothetical protein
MYEAPQSDISDVIITEEVVDGKKPSEYIHRPPTAEVENYDSDSNIEDEQISIGSNQ